MNRRRLRGEDYTVGWVCALPIELAAAQEMLDEEHQDLPRDANDTNLYTLGRIGEHNIVVACLPAGQTGTNSAAAVAVKMKSKFASIQFGLMVGIGGGVPSAEADIWLGDVVVSQPCMEHGGVVQYDFGKSTPRGFIQTGFLNTPPTLLLNALANVRAIHLRRKSSLSLYLSKFNHLPKFARDNAGPDILFESTYNHVGGDTCEMCSRDRLVERPSRGSREIVVHYGTIASGNQVIRDGVTRDRIRSKLGGVLCFEMEAAGLMNSFPCLVIRGICDYADSHKNKSWQGYAAATAAACAKEVLSVIPAIEVAAPSTAQSIMETAGGETRNSIENRGNVRCPITAVSRHSNLVDYLDLFVCGNDGLVYTSSWMQGSIWSSIRSGWKCLGGIVLTPQAYVSAVARRPDHLDLFVCGKDGRVYTTWWSKTSGWYAYWKCLGGSFQSGAQITVVARGPENLDVFACGRDAHIYTSNWSKDSSWSSVKEGWKLLGGSGLHCANVAAVARKPNQLDLFVCATDGSVYTKWWSRNFGWSKQWKRIGSPPLPPGAYVTAVSRKSGQIDLFACGLDGCIYTSWWTDNGHDWSGISNGWKCLGGLFPPAINVSAVARNPEQLDLFVYGKDEHIYTTWWRRGYGWHALRENWEDISRECPSGAIIAGVARSPEHLDLFTCNYKGQVFTSWWKKGSKWSGKKGIWGFLGQLPAENANVNY